MNQFDLSAQMLLEFLAGKAERETLNYVMDGVREALGDNAPDEKSVRDFFLAPEVEAQLTPQEQFIVMDKLLENAEVDFRMTCDLVRYKFMKDAGMVSSVDEFLALFRPDEEV